MSLKNALCNLCSMCCCYNPFGASFSYETVNLRAPMAQTSEESAETGKPQSAQAEHLFANQRCFVPINLSSPPHQIADLVCAHPTRHCHWPLQKYNLLVVGYIRGHQASSGMVIPDDITGYLWKVFKLLFIENDCVLKHTLSLGDFYFGSQCELDRIKFRSITSGESVDMFFRYNGQSIKDNCNHGQKDDQKKNQVTANVINTGDGLPTDSTEKPMAQEEMQETEKRPAKVDIGFRWHWISYRGDDQSYSKYYTDDQNENVNVRLGQRHQLYQQTYVTHPWRFFVEDEFVGVYVPNSNKNRHEFEFDDAGLVSVTGEKINEKFKSLSYTM